MKTRKNYLVSILILFLITVTVGVSMVKAAGVNDTKMLYDDGSSSGGGGNSIQKTNRSLLEALKLLFSGNSSSGSSNNTSGSTNGNNNSNSNNNATGGTNEAEEAAGTDDGQTYTPSPNIESGGELQFADNITKLIQDDCTNEGKGIVTKKNTVSSQIFLKKESCITRASKPLQGGASEVNNSTTAFYYLQCVGCVRAMAAARGRTYPGTGNAKQHIGQKVSGYTYFSNTSTNYAQLVPGSIGISNEGTYGHIFYITDVVKSADGTPKGFKSFECNWGAQGIVRHDKIRPLNYMSGWQRPNSL